MLPGAALGAGWLFAAIATGSAPLLGRIGVGIFSALMLATAIWPIVFAIGARVVVTRDWVRKSYPLKLRTRTLLRRNLGRIETEEASSRTARGGLAFGWTVYSFRARDGNYAFQLGTNFWQSEQLKLLVSTLSKDELPASWIPPAPRPGRSAVWSLRIVLPVLLVLNIGFLVFAGDVWFIAAVVDVVVLVAVVLTMASFAIFPTDLLPFRVRRSDRSNGHARNSDR